jgi:hypothetical protein
MPGFFVRYIWLHFCLHSILHYRECLLCENCRFGLSVFTLLLQMFWGYFIPFTLLFFKHAYYYGTFLIYISRYSSFTFQCTFWYLTRTPNFNPTFDISISFCEWILLNIIYLSLRIKDFYMKDHHSSVCNLLSSCARRQLFHQYPHF